MLYERWLLELWQGSYHGELVAARWTGVGVLEDDKEVPLLGHDILRVADGRFAEYWAGM